MSRKLTYDEVKNEFTKRSLKLLNTTYINNSTPLTFMNKDGYKGVVKLGNLKYGKMPQYFSKHNPFTIDNIRLYLENNGAHSILLSDTYSNSDDLLTLQCECGEIYKRSWNNLYSQTYHFCYKCAIKYRGISQRTGIEQAREMFAQYGYKLLSDEYVNNTEYMECENKEGYRGFQSYAHIQQGKGITYYSVQHNSKYFIYNLNHWAKLNGIKAEVLNICNDEKWIKQGIKVRCECGNIFTTSVDSFKNGKTRCDYCNKSISRLEHRVKLWLDEHNINYIIEYRFDDCRNKLPLPFDFYLPDYNTCIEVDGEGHYKLAYYNNCSKEKAQISLEDRQKTDAIKTDYCKTHNIKLIRIPYWEFPIGYKDILYFNLIKE